MNSTDPEKFVFAFDFNFNHLHKIYFSAKIFYVHSKNSFMFLNEVSIFFHFPVQCIQEDFLQN